jgi:hypothetical protein
MWLDWLSGRTQNPAIVSVAQASVPHRLGIGPGWMALSLAVGAHVADEALTHFLDVYNPTVMEMRRRFAWFPMPTFAYQEWLGGLIAFVVLLLLLSPFAFQGAGWIRPIAYILALIMIANGIGHITFTVLGRTVESVHFARPAPGFYSSPLLLAASIYLLVQLRRTARDRG